MTPELWWNTAEPGDEIVFLPTGRKMGFVSISDDLITAYCELGQSIVRVVERAEAFQPTGWKVPTRG